MEPASNATAAAAMDYLQVAEEEGEEPMELPAEEDGALLLSTLQAQYPGTSGLKYRNPDTNAIRGIRLVDGRLHPPTVEEGWGSQVYICVFPKGEWCCCVNRVSDRRDTGRLYLFVYPFVLCVIAT